MKLLRKLERVPLREAWKHEANDFTPWLAVEGTSTLWPMRWVWPIWSWWPPSIGSASSSSTSRAPAGMTGNHRKPVGKDQPHAPSQMLTYAAGTGAQKVI